MDRARELAGKLIAGALAFGASKCAGAGVVAIVIQMLLGQQVQLREALISELVEHHDEAQRQWAEIRADIDELLAATAAGGGAGQAPVVHGRI
jgi:hypothetical protein